MDAARIRDLHKPVQFTDVSLGIRDETVCCRCHVRLDEPADWDGGEDGDWGFPLVQEVYPCATLVALDA